MPERAVKIVAFDVNETLFSLDRLGPAFAAAGLDPAQVPLWFARVLRDGFALTVLGGYRPFADLLAEEVRGLAPGQVGDDTVAAVLSEFRRLEPHPDVAPAFQLLEQAGVPAITLTNGSADLVGALLRQAGLAGYVQRNLSVDAVRRWKPAPEPYRYAATESDVDPRQVALVAVHPWDCAGANAAGLRAGWVNRRDAHWPAVFTPPEVTGTDLPAVVTQLLALD